MAYVLTPDTPAAKGQDFLDWLREHGIEPRVTFRVEVEEDSMVVHRYALANDGKPYGICSECGEDMAKDHWDCHGRTEAAVEAPVTVALKSPVPLASGGTIPRGSIGIPPQGCCTTGP